MERRINTSRQADGTPHYPAPLGTSIYGPPREVNPAGNRITRLDLTMVMTLCITTPRTCTRPTNITCHLVDHSEEMFCAIITIITPPPPPRLYQYRKTPSLSPSIYLQRPSDVTALGLTQRYPILEDVYADGLRKSFGSDWRASAIYYHVSGQPLFLPSSVLLWEDSKISHIPLCTRQMCYNIQSRSSRLMSLSSVQL